MNEELKRLVESMIVGMIVGIAQAGQGAAAFFRTDALAARALAPVSLPQSSGPAYRVFALSSVVVRQAGFDRVEVFHCARMMAAGSYEQAEENELEYLRGIYPQADGWTHNISGLEVSGGFLSELFKLKLCGRLETRNDAPQKSVLLTVHLGDREATKVESRASDVLEASDAEN